MYIVKTVYLLQLQRIHEDQPNNTEEIRIRPTQLPLGSITSSFQKDGEEFFNVVPKLGYLSESQILLEIMKALSPGKHTYPCVARILQMPPGNSPAPPSPITHHWALGSQPCGGNKGWYQRTDHGVQFKALARRLSHGPRPSPHFLPAPSSPSPAPLLHPRMWS